MAVRKRAPRAKGGPAAAPTPRVVRIASTEKWGELLGKAEAQNRLVVVQFYQMGMYVCTQMRPYFMRLSVEHRFKHVVFAEAEVGEAEEVATSCGVQRVPTYQVYHKGALVDSFSGGQPDRVAAMLRDALAMHCPSRRGLGAKLALAAGVAAAGMLGFLAWRWAGAPAPGSAGAAAAELKRLRAALASAQAKLTALRAAKSGKAERAARAQQKVVARLQAKKEDLERSLARAEAATGVGVGMADGRRRAAAAAAATDEVRGYSDEEEQENAGAMYSDEE